MKHTLIACLATSLLASAASADTVQAQFTGTGYGQNVSVSQDSGANFGNVFAGQLQYTLSSSSGPTYYLNGQWISFCTELGQFTNGNNQLYTVMDVADLPIPGAGMGAAKAGMVAQLFTAAAGSQYSASNDLASAFQLAVWEIVNDYDGSTLASMDLGTGIFRGNVNGTIGGMVSTFLSGAFNASSGADIIGLGSETYQDQLIEVPAPGVLALLGFAGLSAPRRRRA